MNKRGEPTDFVPVYNAPDELSLLRVQSALRAEDIDARVRSFETPMFDDAVKDPSGLWGDVLVPRKDVARAREIIDVVTTGEIVPNEPPADDAGEEDAEG